MNSNLILFDGVCNFCNYWVNFIIDRDKKRIFKFASLQSDLAQNILKEKNINTAEIDSIILIMDEKIFIKSSAALQIASKLNGFWKLFSFLYVVPSPLRDFLYDFVASNRYKWFGKSDSCRIPTEDEKERFLTN